MTETLLTIASNWKLKISIDECIMDKCILINQFNGILLNKKKNEHE
jgi:hypothetical protein